MPDTRSKKRARVDSLTPLPQELVDATRCPTVWFDDGNIILQVQATQFRVHKGVLSKHSEKLLRLLSEVSEASPSIEGCPVILLKGGVGSEVHWQQVLELLYDGRRVYNASSRYSFSTVEAMLAVGKEYEFIHLVKEALEQFEETFSEELIRRKSNRFPSSGFYLDDRSCISDVLDAALDYGVNRSLPAIYMHILTQNSFPANIFDGLERGDKSTGEFTSQSQRVLMLGRDRVYEAMATHMFRWLWLDSGVVPTKECQVPRACKLRLLRLHSDHWKPVPKIIKALKPWDPQDFPGLCHRCVSAVQGVYEQGQEEFWNELPTYFDLPPWAELENAD
ncbi:hypothetical protein BKA70DRAFT_1189628 [Coprinopsis sp. MPI-PUGE-AT-0042]|nr:hypothetical protein BKA70DRAFT_1189628 [Coprinopsis sp. MPI-PUGE-AT-0042]